MVPLVLLMLPMVSVAVPMIPLVKLIVPLAAEKAGQGSLVANGTNDYNKLGMHAL